MFTNWPGMVIDFMKMMLPITTDEALVRRFRRIVDAWDNGSDRIMRGAPHLIVVHSPADLPLAAEDCTIALTYLELYAHAKGLGTCWAGYFKSIAGLHEPLIKALDLPAGHKCFGAVMLGSPQYRDKKHSMKHTLSETDNFVVIIDIYNYPPASAASCPPRHEYSPIM